MSKIDKIIENGVKSLMIENLEEKAVSKNQQQFMGMVHAYKKGEMKDAPASVKKAAKGMTKKAAKDFASTKHKGLPTKVNEGVMSELDIELQDSRTFEEFLANVKSNPKFKSLSVDKPDVQEFLLDLFNQQKDSLNEADEIGGYYLMSTLQDLADDSKRIGDTKMYDAYMYLHDRIEQSYRDIDLNQDDIKDLLNEPQGRKHLNNFPDWAIKDLFTESTKQSLNEGIGVLAATIGMSVTAAIAGGIAANVGGSLDKLTKAVVSAPGGASKVKQNLSQVSNSLWQQFTRKLPLIGPRLKKRDEERRINAEIVQALEAFIKTQDGEAFIKTIIQDKAAFKVLKQISNGSRDYKKLYDIVKKYIYQMIDGKGDMGRYNANVEWNKVKKLFFALRKDVKGGKFKDALKEYTDNNFSGAKLIADMASEKPDSEDMEFITKYFPNAVKSMSKAKAKLQASDNSPIKKRMGQYAPMFVHVQYHTFTETSGQTFGVHQTQYYNSNFKDQDPSFNPRVTELNFFGGEDQNDKMGGILATTDEYIKDLRDLERLGMLGKRVSESLKEEDKFYDADKEQDDENVPNPVDDEGRPLNEGKGLDEASKLIKHLREKVYRNLNDQELEEFTKEMVDHLGGTINENKMSTKTESIVKRLKEDDAYQKFFKSAMDKFGIKSPADLKSDKKKKEFFNYVDKNYKAKNESLNEDFFAAHSSDNAETRKAITQLNNTFKALQDQYKVPTNVLDTAVDLVNQLVEQGYEDGRAEVEGML
jgi:hypothetical protein